MSWAVGIKEEEEKQPLNVGKGARRKEALSVPSLQTPAPKDASGLGPQPHIEVIQHNQRKERLGWNVCQRQPRAEGKETHTVAKKAIH